MIYILCSAAFQCNGMDYNINRPTIEACRHHYLGRLNAPLRHNGPALTAFALGCDYERLPVNKIQHYR